MDWEALGFTDDPLDTIPIKQKTLNLYVGSEEQIRICSNVLSGKNVRLVIEGARGIGTTSFGNLIRFNAQNKKKYFTPPKEIRVEAGWSIDTLFAAIISNIVRGLELLFAKQLKTNTLFQEAKAISNRLSEVYRSFGAQLGAYGFSAGASYSQAPTTMNQPIIVPTNVLGEHLETLAAIAKELGFKHGLLIQLNNLDVGVIHDAAHLRYLFNALQDYMQTDGISWIMVVDEGLRAFIAQEVDRLDDIISHEVFIEQLSEQAFQALVTKRVEFFRVSPNIDLPIDWEVMLYLYKLTHGRLRYVFGLLSRMLRVLHIGDLADKISMETAKPLITQLVKERLRKQALSEAQESLLKILATQGQCAVAELTKQANKSASHLSHLLKSLEDMRLIKRTQQGKNVFVEPIFDVILAYG